MPINHRIVLDNRPQGEATTRNFKMVELPLPELKDGEVLVCHHFLSLDPYMRGRMNESKSYAVPQPLGEVMIGGTVGEVVDSRHPKFKAGDQVVGMGGWQEYSVVDANVIGALRKVDTTHVPLSHYLGAVGMPGVTAWYGLVKIINPKAGETVTVSAASGAVGSAYGALAKARGCRVIGIAGGKDKCDYVTHDLGFDACIDYKQHNDYLSLSKALKDVCPDGIDGHFENVGGLVMPIILRFTFSDDSTEVIRIPVEIWRQYEDKVSKVFIFDKEVKEIRLDPFLETADVDLNNNAWPAEIQPSRYQLFKQNQPKENPMQRQKRVDAIKN